MYLHDKSNLKVKILYPIIIQINLKFGQKLLAIMCFRVLCFVFFRALNVMVTVKHGTPYLYDFIVLIQVYFDQKKCTCGFNSECSKSAEHSKH